MSDTSRGDVKRLSTLSPGMGFGEQFLVEGALRSAFVRADRPSVCWVLRSEAYRRLAAARPGLALRLVENLLQSTSRIVDRLTGEAVSERL